MEEGEIPLPLAKEEEILMPPLPTIEEEILVEKEYKEKREEEVQEFVQHEEWEIEQI